jgi:acyl-ACP thioesterase
MLEKRAVFTVSTYHCDSQGRIHLHSLMQQLQEIASKHAEDLGVGRKWMDENGYYWVLVNFKMDISRLPGYKETVILKTWPSGWDLLKAFRDFKGEDLEGTELFRATSEWMVIDKNNFRPKTTKELEFDFISSKNRIINDIQRLRSSQALEEIFRINVPSSSIDMNGHVNNTEYVRWGIDTLWACSPNEGTIRSFGISYISEVFKNEELILKRKDMGKNHIQIVGSKANGGKDTFVMEIVRS